MKDEPAAAVLSVAADHVQAGLRWAQLEFSSLLRYRECFTHLQSRVGPNASSLIPFVWSVDLRRLGRSISTA